MEPVQQYCFSLSPGEDIYLFTLRNKQGSTVTITNYGATLTSFRVNTGTVRENDILLGFDEIRDYLSPAYLAQYPWMGSAVGRNANRIRNARFQLDGKTYQLTRNNGNEQLHGGPGGFDRKAWKPVGMGDSPFPFLELSYLSPDGDEGYPGNLDVKIRFELNDENELSYTYHATTDQATPVNLTHHAYFNLDNGEGTILDQEIKIGASRMLDQDEHLVATGEILSVGGTPYDLRDFEKIADGLKQIDEYDKSFVVDTKDKNVAWLASARSKKSDLRVDIFSDQPILHFYSGKWIPAVTGKRGIPYGPFTGFCLETHKYPNAVNIPHFPGTILRPGEEYFHKTIYKVKQESGV